LGGVRRLGGAAITLLPVADVVIDSAGTGEQRLVAAARAGNLEAFRELTEPYYRELHIHCYRMLGSYHDAEDLVQETFLRVWRGLDKFEGRAQFRSWLYKIATNACLKELAGRRRRMLPRDLGPAADPLEAPSPPSAEVVQLDPYPDVLLRDSFVSEDPQQLYTFRESLELAFLAAIHLLTPRQRAVLILRDVLGWRAVEVATLLEASVVSVNSALSRARATLARRLPPHQEDVADGLSFEASERSVLARYMRAWEKGDMNALAALLRRDALLTMPPASTWLEGPEAIAAFFHSLCFTSRPKRFRMLPTHANGQPACAAYEWDAGAGCYRFSGLMVLRLRNHLIAEITGFGDRGLHSLFSLPEALAPEPPT
jgi:RNA polymerase sigma-70 factor (ECF subfamily)